MAFNQIENIILSDAIKRLKPKYELVYGKFNGFFYLGNGVRFILIKKGPDKDKLTIAKKVNSEYIPDPNIEPEDCYNLIKPDEDLASAINRIYYNKQQSLKIKKYF